MDEDRSARLALPLLHAGQAQKEMDHNEALALIDMTVQATVVAVAQDMPPVDPVAGACWIVGAAAEGAWTGHDGELAAWTAAGWRFVVPFEGMAAWCLSEGVVVRYRAGGWRSGIVTARAVEIAGLQVTGARQPAVGMPVGGATIDQPARDAIAAILDRLQAHGLIAR